MHNPESLIDLMQTEARPFWRLSKNKFGQKVSSGQHLDSNLEKPLQLQEGVNRLSNLLDKIGSGHFEVELMKTPNSHSGNKLILDLRIGAAQNPNENQGLGGLMEEYRSSLEGVAAGMLGAEKQKNESLIEGLRKEMLLALREKDLQQKEEKIKERESELKELELKYNSDFEKFGAGLGMVFQNLIGQFAAPAGMAAGTLAGPQLDEREQLIDKLATHLAESVTDLGHLRNIVRIVNTYINQPEAALWQPFKTKNNA
jgi:hypothetical protein